MIELVDVLDEHGIKTGEVLSRDECHVQSKLYRGVVVCVLNENNDMLLQQRSMSKKITPGAWDFSARGGVVAGEESKVAAAREVAEEVGLHFAPDELIFIGNMRDEYVAGAGLARVTFDVFAAYTNRDIKDIVFDKAEVTAVKYTSMDDVMTSVRDANPNEFMLQTNVCTLVRDWLGKNAQKKKD